MEGEGQPVVVLVVGGGLFGVTAAMELAARGNRVHLFDMARLPANDAASTDVSKMVRMDYGNDELYRKLAKKAIRGWRQWNKEWERPLYHEQGLLVLTQEPLNEGSFEHESYKSLLKKGYSLERMTKERLRERFPLWGKSGRYVDGYYSSNHAGWVESGEVMKVLTKMAERAGVVMHECVGVREVLYETDPVQRRKKAVGIVTSTNHAFYGDHVLVAAGAWTPTLLPELRGVMWGSGQPVFHLKRLSRTEGGPKDGPDPLFLSDKYPMFFADIAKTGWYGFPSTADGLLKIGNHGHGYKMAAGYPKLLVPPAEVERFKQFLAESLPDLAQLPIVNTRLCLYCDTFDGDFFISRSPHVDGLSVAAGDSGHGFKFAPVIGPVIADVVEGKANKIAPRFAWRTNIEQDHSARGGVSSRPKEPPKVNPYERSLVASNL